LLSDQRPRSSFDDAEVRGWVHTCWLGCPEWHGCAWALFCPWAFWQIVTMIMLWAWVSDFVLWLFTSCPCDLWMPCFVLQLCEDHCSVPRASCFHLLSIVNVRVYKAHLTSFVRQQRVQLNSSLHRDQLCCAGTALSPVLCSALFTDEDIVSCYVWSLYWSSATSLTYASIKVFIKYKRIQEVIFFILFECKRYPRCHQ